METQSVQRLFDSLQGGDAVSTRRVAGEIRPEDIAQILADVDESTCQLVLALLSDAKAAQVLAECDERLQAQVLEGLGTERACRLLEEMDPDDAVDVLGTVAPERRDALLAGLDVDVRRDVRLLGGYDPESAGGIMTTEVVAVGSNESVASAIDKLAQAEQREAMVDLFVVDPAGSLVGQADLQRLLTAERDDPVAAVMDTDVVSIHVDADQEEAARIVDRYHLSTLPVVDDAGRLKGVITADDIMEVLSEEASEDMLRLAGTGVLHPTNETVLRRLVARAPWLSVTLVGTFVASLILETIERRWFPVPEEVDPTFKLLLYFIPLIGGMAGNVGSQSSTIMVRGFATGEVDPARPMRVLPGELVLAVLIGLGSGLLVGVATALVHVERPWLGLVVGMALPCAIFVAAVTGTLVPFACQIVKVDPAYASGPFLLTMNDIAAYVIYFTVAVLMMQWLGVL